MFDQHSSQKAQCEVFLRQNLGLLYRVAASYEADLGRREDLLQDICLAIWQATPRFEARSSFKTFALRVAHNRGISHGVRAARSPRWVDLAEDAPSQALDPAAATERALLQESLMAAVRQLRVEQRQIVVLALEGLSYQEISDVLDLSVSNVGVRLNRAKARLREVLNERV